MMDNEIGGGCPGAVGKARTCENGAVTEGLVTEPELVVSSSRKRYEVGSVIGEQSCWWREGNSGGGLGRGLGADGGLALVDVVGGGGTGAFGRATKACKSTEAILCNEPGG